MSTAHAHATPAGAHDAAAFSKALDALTKKEADAKRVVTDAAAERDERIARARANALKILEKASAESQQEREAILADASYDVDRQVDAIMNAAKVQSRKIADTRNPDLARKIAKDLVA
jgi:vacuolar-type H+-ATPase subunit H